MAIIYVIVVLGIIISLIIFAWPVIFALLVIVAAGFLLLYLYAIIRRSSEPSKKTNQHNKETNLSSDSDVVSSIDSYLEFEPEPDPDLYHLNLDLDLDKNNNTASYKAPEKNYDFNSIPKIKATDKKPTNNTFLTMIYSCLGLGLILLVTPIYHHEETTKDSSYSHFTPEEIAYLTSQESGNINKYKITKDEFSLYNSINHKASLYGISNQSSDEKIDDFLNQMSIEENELLMRQEGEEYSRYSRIESLLNDQAPPCQKQTKNRTILSTFYSNSPRRGKG